MLGEDSAACEPRATETWQVVVGSIVLGAAFFAYVPQQLAIALRKSHVGVSFGALTCAVLAFTCATLSEVATGLRESVYGSGGRGGSDEGGGSGGASGSASSGVVVVVGGGGQEELPPLELKELCWSVILPLVAWGVALLGAQIAWTLYLVFFDTRWLEARFLDGRAAWRREVRVAAVTPCIQVGLGLILVTVWATDADPALGSLAVLAPIFNLGAAILVCAGMLVQFYVTYRHKRTDSFSVTATAFVALAYLCAAFLEANWKPWCAWAPLVLAAALALALAVFGIYCDWTTPVEPWSKSPTSGRSGSGAAKGSVLDFRRANKTRNVAELSSSDSDDGDDSYATPHATVYYVPADNNVPDAPARFLTRSLRPATAINS